MILTLSQVLGVVLLLFVAVSARGWIQTLRRVYRRAQVRAELQRDQQWHDNATRQQQMQQAIAEWRGR